VTRPITNKQLIALDAELAYRTTNPGAFCEFTYAEVAALRERLRLAEMHAGSDREDCLHWWQRYLETRNQLARADAIIDSADRYVNTDWQEIHVLQGLIAAYRAAKEKHAM
jgi:hypothetical protein